MRSEQLIQRAARLLDQFKASHHNCLCGLCLAYNKLIADTETAIVDTQVDKLVAEEQYKVEANKHGWLGV